MAVTDDRRFTMNQVISLLNYCKGKKLGEVDKKHLLEDAKKTPGKKGIAGDVIEQSVFGYKKDSKQECDIEIDGVLHELKTTGVRIKKGEWKKKDEWDFSEYKRHLGAKEGVTMTHVTFEPTIQTDFQTSHLWEKSERIIFVIYDYFSQVPVPAFGYSKFQIIDYFFNKFTEGDIQKITRDWESVRDYLKPIYEQYDDPDERNLHLCGFTKVIRKQLTVTELVPAFKQTITKKGKISYQKPRYRFKHTFIDFLIRDHFGGNRGMVSLNVPFADFNELDERCHNITMMYQSKTFGELKRLLHIDTDMSTKDFAAKCVIKMFDVSVKRLNKISDFAKTGIIAKTIITTPNGGRTEDMKLSLVNLGEFGSEHVEFEDSEFFSYFCEHSFLCPVFCQRGDLSSRRKGETKYEYKARLKREIKKTTFEGFKRFAFDDDFLEQEVKRTWIDSRKLIFEEKLKWEYVYDKDGNKRINGSGAYMGAPNFPKSSEYTIFFRGGADVSDEKARTECVNGIRMLPQFFWLKGSYIANKLKEIPYL